MDKKTIIIVAILVVIVVIYFPALNFLGLVEEPPPQDTTRVETQTTPAETTTSTPSEPVRQQAPAAGSPAEPTGMAELTQPTDSLPVDTVIVRTNKMVTTLISKGGGPVGLELSEHYYRNGYPVQMLDGAAQATPDLTFAGGSFSTSRVAFVSDVAPGEYEATSSTFEMTYRYQGAGGGEIIKTYRFYPDEYHYDLLLTVNNPTQMGFERRYNVVWNTPLTPTEPQLDVDYTEMKAVAMQSGSREELDDFNDGRLDESLDGQTSWAGVREKYFAAVIIPRSRLADGVFARGVEAEIRTEEGDVDVREITAGLSMPFAAVETVVDSFQVYVGPLDYSIMSDYNVELEDILGIGTTPFVGWIIKPFALGIIWLLPRMYDFLPNYGLVIILFALLVKIITLPLSLRSFKSMSAMKDLQPQIEALKTKHKKNPQAMNAEMMKLYKKHGVNPLSGCLPIIPQMPLFFALFSVFRSTILLRDAPFIWFIDDLSRGATGFADPYIVLVVIMVLAQFFSQKVTMASATQQNKALMYIMPLFFGFLFYRFSAGLVLYWTCFSMFSLLDYVIFKRKKAISAGGDVKPA